MLRVDVDGVLADLRQLAEPTGGPGGARRLAWTPDWLAARGWLTGKLAGLPVTVERDVAGNLWASLPGGDVPGFVSVGSHIDADALRVAIDAYGRAAGQTLELVAAGPLEVGAR